MCINAGPSAVRLQRAVSPALVCTLLQDGRAIPRAYQSDPRTSRGVNGRFRWPIRSLPLAGVSFSRVLGGFSESHLLGDACK